MTKKLIFSLLIILAAGIQAQTKLIFQKNNSSDEYNITTIQKITFSGNSLTVHKTDQTTVEKQFVDFSKILFQLSTGFGEVNKTESHFTVFPTVAMNEIQITGDAFDDAQGQLSIYSSIGQLVYIKSLNTSMHKQIPVSNLTQGVYYVVWHSNGQVYQSKFIKK